MIRMCLHINVNYYLYENKNMLFIDNSFIPYYRKYCLLNNEYVIASLNSTLSSSMIITVSTLSLLFAFILY